MSRTISWTDESWKGHEGARRFENLCHDLLFKMGFQRVVWRGGEPADDGRDIEARLIVPDPIEGSREETWFVECKNFPSGRSVSVSDMGTKIAWADAESPNALLIITNTMLSNKLKAWLNEMQSRKPFRLQFMERPRLEEEIRKYRELHDRYFPMQFDPDIEKPYLCLLDSSDVIVTHGISLFQESFNKSEILQKLRHTLKQDGVARVRAGEALEKLGHPATSEQVEHMVTYLEQEHPGFLADYLKNLGEATTAFSNFSKSVVTFLHAIQKKQHGPEIDESH